VQCCEVKKGVAAAAAAVAAATGLSRHALLIRHSWTRQETSCSAAGIQCVLTRASFAALVNNRSIRKDPSNALQR